MPQKHPAYLPSAKHFSSNSTSPTTPAKNASRCETTGLQPSTPQSAFADTKTTNHPTSGRVQTEHRAGCPRTRNRETGRHTKRLLAYLSVAKPPLGHKSTTPFDTKQARPPPPWPSEKNTPQPSGERFGREAGTPTARRSLFLRPGNQQQSKKPLWLRRHFDEMTPVEKMVAVSRRFKSWGLKLFSYAPARLHPPRHFETVTIRLSTPTTAAASKGFPRLDGFRVGLLSAFRPQLINLGQDWSTFLGKRR